MAIPRIAATAARKLMEHFLIGTPAGRGRRRGASRWPSAAGIGTAQSFTAGRQDMPMLDQGLDAPLSTTCTSVAWKRTCPWSSGANSAARRKINNSAGRDHWPQCQLRLLAGGGMRTGQVIGSTDRIAAQAKDRPVHFQEVFATLYHAPGHRSQHDHGHRPDRPPAIFGRPLSTDGGIGVAGSTFRSPPAPAGIAPAVHRRQNRDGSPGPA